MRLLYLAHLEIYFVIKIQIFRSLLIFDVLLVPHSFAVARNRKVYNMATSYLIRAVTHSTKCILGVIQRGAIAILWCYKQILIHKVIYQFHMLVCLAQHELFLQHTHDCSSQYWYTACRTWNIPCVVATCHIHILEAIEPNSVLLCHSDCDDS